MLLVPMSIHPFIFSFFHLAIFNAGLFLVHSITTVFLLEVKLMITNDHVYHVIKCPCHRPLSDLQVKTWRGMTAAQTGPSLCHRRCTISWGNPVSHNSLIFSLDSHRLDQSDYQHQTEAHTKLMSTFFSQVEDPKTGNAFCISILVYVYGCFLQLCAAE